MHIKIRLVPGEGISSASAGARAWLIPQAEEEEEEKEKEEDGKCSGVRGWCHPHEEHSGVARGSLQEAMLKLQLQYVLCTHELKK